MDPQVALHDLMEAMSRNDRVAVDQLLTSLHVWNRGGGFMPTVLRNSFTGHFIVPRRVPKKPANGHQYKRKGS